VGIVYLACGGMTAWGEYETEDTSIAPEFGGITHRRPFYDGAAIP